jgi:hypothetical protein
MVSSMRSATFYVSTDQVPPDGERTRQNDASPQISIADAANIINKSVPLDGTSYNEG